MRMMSFFVSLTLIAINFLYTPLNIRYPTAIRGLNSRVKKNNKLGEKENVSSKI